MKQQPEKKSLIDHRAEFQAPVLHSGMVVSVFEPDDIYTAKPITLGELLAFLKEQKDG